MFVTERRKWLGVKLALLGFAVGVLGFLVARWKFEPGMAITFAGIALSLVGAVIHRVWLERYGIRRQLPRMSGRRLSKPEVAQN